MTWLAFESIYTGNNQWLSPGYIQLDAEQKIITVTNQDPPQIDRRYGQALLPGFPNAHSHAFQYAMAGLAENLQIPSNAQTTPATADPNSTKAPKQGPDDFWSWRKHMYQLALTLNPSQLQDIATDLYKEMRRQGYDHVAEFHYLHHDPQGQPYANRGQMMESLAAAAQQAELNITFVPVYYAQGGFGQPPQDQQRRFISHSVDDYLLLVEAAQKLAKEHPHVHAGCGIHSLRAASPERIQEIFKTAPPQLPLHIHVAEQEAEIQDCLRYWKSRPVQWLLDNVELNARCFLVHSTHVEKAEWQGLIKSQAQVVLCPSTEANLGDGFFPIEDFHHAGGQWCIGSDSHVGLNPMEELRWLDYGARLRLRKRNVLCAPQNTQSESGQQLFDQALRSGRQALGLPAQWFQPRDRLSGNLLQLQHPRLKSCPPEQRLSTLIYASNGGQSWIEALDLLS